MKREIFPSSLATVLTFLLIKQLANSLCQAADAKSFPHLSVRLSSPFHFIHSFIIASGRLEAYLSLLSASVRCNFNRLLDQFPALKPQC